MAKVHYQGEVFYANLPGGGKNIQEGIRPVVIIQNNTGNRYSPTVTVVPLTSKMKALHLPTHVVVDNGSLDGISRKSVALAEQVTTIPVDSLYGRIGRLSQEDIKKTRDAVIAQIAISL